MLKNYIMVALRNLSRYKFFSSINIFGLAISMSVCFGIIMLVADQLQYDRYNTKRQRIYRINTQYLNADGSNTGNDYATSPLILAPTLREEFSGVEKAVRIRRGFGNGWIEFEQDVSIPLGGFFTDPEFLEVFELELEFGNEKTALSDPYSVVLTKKAARKLFNVENPVGEVIKVGKLGEYKVTGVLRESGRKSHIVYEALASYSTLKSLDASKVFSEDAGWANFTAGWVYVLLPENADIQQLQTNLDKLSRVHKPGKFGGTDERLYKFYPQLLSSITPGPFINNPIGPFMPRIFVYFFGGLALIVMLTSCFNYTNLSIARSLTRAKEIGIRKVTGANRLQIFLQFISESVVLSLFALAFAFVLLLAVKPFLLNLKFAQILKWDLELNTGVYLVFVAFAVVAGIMAGFFPAVILSRLEPVRILKKIGSVKLFSRLTLRKSLLVIQFSLSLVFILSVLVLYKQLTLFMKADHGFNMHNQFNIKLNNTSWEKLQNELSTYSNISITAAASHIPAAGNVYGDSYKRNLSDKEVTSFSYFCVDAHYLKALSIPLIAGRNFGASDGESNKGFILINESGFRKLGFDSPHDAIGEVVYESGDSSRYEIIGVVKDYNHEVLITKIDPMALKYNPQRFNYLHVGYNGTPEEGRKSIERAWAKINPNQKIDYKDFEEEVRGFYNTVFRDFVSVVGVISFMAIVISCLGLLGMATYTTETRMKEISIRKVLGSGTGELVLLLSRGFLTLLVLSVLIAVPVAYFINSLWLEHLAYRTSFSTGVILTGTFILFLLGIITIGSQTMRAAFVNPAESLKND